MNDASQIRQLIDQKSKIFNDLNDAIWATPELFFREHQSAAALVKVMEAEGFSVETGVAGLATAFVATYGTGSPVIGILAEYDALPSLSQVSCATERVPIIPGGPGHGCGHNTLGAGSAQAAVAMKEYMQQNNIPGTVKLFGCPAEEGGSGKTYMLREGVFSGVDAAITWHPFEKNAIWSLSSLANRAVKFSFNGKSSHAAAAPHLGRSALDACELLNVGVNYLREHVVQEARMHYAYQDVGGSAPNVVQNHASILYFIRAPKASQALEISERVFDVARGAALMTGTTLEIEVQGGCCDFLPNSVVSRLLSDCFQEMGGPEFDEADETLARTYFDGYTPDQRGAIVKEAAMFMDLERAKKFAEMPLLTDVFPFYVTDVAIPGSTDVGDVSYAVPTAQLGAACYANGTPGHSWQLVAQSGSSISHKGMQAAARAMALCGLRLLQSPELLQKAKAELLQKTGGVIPSMLAPGQQPIIPEE